MGIFKTENHEHYHVSKEAAKLQEKAAQHNLDAAREQAWAEEEAARQQAKTERLRIKTADARAKAEREAELEKARAQRDAEIAKAEAMVKAQELAQEHEARMKLMETDPEAYRKLMQKEEGNKATKGLLAGLKKIDEQYKVNNSGEITSVGDAFNSVFKQSMKGISQELSGSSPQQAKYNLIMNTTVPDDREDLLGLLAFVAPKADKDAYRMSYSLGAAYWTLFEGCITTAKVYYAQDPNFKPYFDKYEEMKNTKLSFLGKLKKVFEG